MMWLHSSCSSLSVLLGREETRQASAHQRPVSICDLLMISHLLVAVDGPDTEQLLHSSKAQPSAWKCFLELSEEVQLTL